MGEGEEVRFGGGGSAGEISGDAPENGFSDALALMLGGIEEEALVRGVADERDLGEHGRHVGSGEDQERSVLDAAVGFLAADRLELRGEGLLNIRREAAGFDHFVSARDFAKQIREFVERRFGGSIFARGKVTGFGGVGEAKVKGFRPADVMKVAGVGMHGDKQIRVRIVGDGGALFERDVAIVAARVHDFRAGKILLNKLAEAEADVEAEIFFEEAVVAGSAGIVTPVAWVDGDAADLEAELAGEGELPRGNVG